MPDPFATAAEVARFAGIEEPSDLSRLQLLLELASARARMFNDQEISQVTGDTVILEPTYSNRLFLPEIPVTAITSITINAVAFTDFGFTRAGMIYRNDSRHFEDLATVVYTHGYVESDPEYVAVKDVVIEAALRAFTRDEQGTAQAMGNTIMQTAGYVPVIFFTEEEKQQLMFLGNVGVG